MLTTELTYSMEQSIRITSYNVCYTKLLRTPAQAQGMHAFIRRTLADLYGNAIAGEISILYGGSVNAANSAELFSADDIDGGLVGGASLKAEDFKTIIKSL